MKIYPFLFAAVVQGRDPPFLPEPLGGWAASLTATALNKATESSRSRSKRTETTRQENLVGTTANGPRGHDRLGDQDREVSGLPKLVQSVPSPAPLKWGIWRGLSAEGQLFLCQQMLPHLLGGPFGARTLICKDGASMGKRWPGPTIG